MRTPVRLKAFLIHLGVSVALLTVVTLLFVLLWFPPPFFFAEKAWKLVFLVGGVDATVGPLLTLIVFNPKKPKLELVRDLTVIALIQAAAMTLGLYTVYGQRTTAVVLTDGTFFSFDADAAAEAGITAVLPVEGRPPRWGVIDLPDDLDERQWLRQQAMSNNEPLYTRSEFLIPMEGEAARAELAQTAPDLEKFLRRHPEMTERFDDFAKRHGKNREDFWFFAVQGRMSRLLVAISRENLDIAGWLESDRALRELI